MEKQICTIHVCRECVGFSEIAQTLKANIDTETFKIKSTKCMGQCKKACNIAITSTNKMSCLFVDITDKNISEIYDVLNEYRIHKTGHINFLSLSEDNKKRYAARLPPSK